MYKRIIKLQSILTLIVAIISFNFVGIVSADDVSIQSEPATYYKGSSTVVQPGDILVTNGTVSNGLTGHAGIVIDKGGTIITINGPGTSLSRQDLDSWYSKYGSTKVMRWTKALGSPNGAQLAANWASSYQINYVNKVSYGLINQIGLYEKETYCSKIAWDAFYYGANISIDGYTYLWSGIYAPYWFLNANGFSQVASYGSF